MPTEEMLRYLEGPFAERELGAAVDLGEFDEDSIKIVAELVQERYRTALEEKWPEPFPPNTICIVPQSAIENLEIKPKTKFRGLLRRFEEGVVRYSIDVSFIEPLNFCKQLADDTQLALVTSQRQPSWPNKPRCKKGKTKREEVTEFIYHCPPQLCWATPKV